jgi:hypothetical protein
MYMVVHTNIVLFVLSNQRAGYRCVYYAGGNVHSLLWAGQVSFPPRFVRSAQRPGNFSDHPTGTRSTERPWRCLREDLAAGCLRIPCLPLRKCCAVMQYLFIALRLAD